MDMINNGYNGHLWTPNLDGEKSCGVCGQEMTPIAENTQCPGYQDQGLDDDQEGE